MKVALVHDYLSQDGGAERVVEAMQEIWPEATLFTLFHDKKNAHPRFLKKNIITSFLQKIPFAKKHYQWFLPLMPLATESYNLSEYDVVISSTSAFAKGIITQPNTLHLCYCHTPTRYLWTDTVDYIESLPYPWLVKKILPPFISRLRQWDALAAMRVNIFIANSQTVAQRIKTFYQREAHVIFPPVDTDRCRPNSKNNDFFLTGGRLVPYKRFDIPVRACTRLGLPLVIFGDGPTKKSLEKIAGPTIKFVGRISDAQKIKLYQHCKAFIHPQNEDFGITPIEAMACGRPVIAYAQGGATETVIDGITGEFFHKQTWEDCAHTLNNFNSKNYNQNTIVQHARTFSRYQFKHRLRELVEHEWRTFKNTPTPQQHAEINQQIKALAKKITMQPHKQTNL